MHPSLLALTLFALRSLPLLVWVAFATACGGSEVDCGNCGRPSQSPPAAAPAASGDVDPSIAGSLVEIVSALPDGSHRRRGTGLVVSRDGIIATANGLAPERRVDGSPVSQVTVHADGVVLLARVIAASAQRSSDYGAGLVTFLKVDRPGAFPMLPLLADRLTSGDSVRVVGYRDGPGVGEGNAAVTIPAIVADDVIPPTGGAGTREDPSGAPADRSPLFVITVDALEDVRGAAVLDRAGRVRGIVTERVMGTERRWIATRVGAELVRAVEHHVSGR